MAQAAPSTLLRQEVCGPRFPHRQLTFCSSARAILLSLGPARRMQHSLIVALLASLVERLPRSSLDRALVSLTPFGCDNSAPDIMHGTKPLTLSVPHPLYKTQPRGQAVRARNHRSEKRWSRPLCMQRGDPNNCVAM
eukprot:5071714-Prymnesium_polylepis.2